MTDSSQPLALIANAGVDRFHFAIVYERYESENFLSLNDCLSAKLGHNACGAMQYGKIVLGATNLLLNLLAAKVAEIDPRICLLESIDFASLYHIKSQEAMPLSCPLL